MRDLIHELEASARARFVRWDPEGWRELLAGPAQALAASLEAAGLAEDHRRGVVESYLRLGCEGIGLGYLYPPAAGALNFFSLAWTRLLPEGLAAVAPERQAATLAHCWNLGENLESSPAWLRRIFLRLCEPGLDLAGLETFVTDAARRAVEPPSRPLGSAARVEWVPLADQDRRFLPGGVHFVAPAVVCVHDRLRTDAGGREAATIGVWLDERPLVLGPMGCVESPPKDPGLRLDVLEALGRREPRASDWHAMAANEWRVAVTLETSQFLVALLPG